jgi:hypothetical protein
MHGPLNIKFWFGIDGSCPHRGTSWGGGGAPAALSPGQNLSNHWIWGWTRSRDGLDNLEKKKYFAPIGNRPLDRTGYSLVNIPTGLLRFDDWA